MQDRAYHFNRKLADWHSDDRQRHDGRAAHRIYIRQRIGRGYAPEVERVIDDGHEKIGGGDDRLMIVQAVYGSVIAGFRANQQIGKQHLIFGFTKNFLQQGWRDFAAAAASMRQLGQFHFRHYRLPNQDAFQNREPITAR